MLATIAIILLVLWILGFLTHVAGAFIHVVLIIAIVMFVLHFIRGRRAV